MNFFLVKSLIFSLFVILTVQANAQTEAEIQGKQSLGFFYTSNANLAYTQPIADTYSRLDSKWYGDIQDVPFYFGLSWYNYAKEKSNNMLSVTLSSDLAQESETFGSYRIVPKIFHRNYIFNTAATSDSSFTNTGIGLDLEKTLQKNSSLDISSSVGLESKRFSQFENRWDHEGHITGDIEYDLNPTLHLNGFSGFGLVFSTLSEYSHSYLDLGFGASGPINADWTWSSEIQIVQKNYFNRTISQSTEITNRRGVTSSVLSTTNEIALLTNLKSTATYKYSTALSFESGLLFAKQGSNNAVNRYNNFEVFTSVIFRGP